MLLLTRKINESVILGDDVQVKIMGMKGQCVILGFNAPKDLPVHRQEVFERIRNEKKAQKNIKKA